MFNQGMKKEAIVALETAQMKLKNEFSTLCDATLELFEIRRNSVDIIVQVGNYLSGLNGAPADFLGSLSVCSAESADFTNVLSDIEVEINEANVKAGVSAVAGAAAGAAVAAYAPSAAMAFATAFGTASTGALISDLTGIYAINAALAWLGGGTLAVGGGGMAAGEALLALSGPVGWSIAVTIAVGAGLYARSSNRADAEAAVAKADTLNERISKIRASRVEIRRLFNATERHGDKALVLLAQLQEKAPESYEQFYAFQKEWLTSLIDHTRSLSHLLNQHVQM